MQFTKLTWAFLYCIFWVGLQLSYLGEPTFPYRELVIIGMLYVIICIILESIHYRNRTFFTIITIIWVIIICLVALAISMDPKMNITISYIEAGIFISVTIGLFVYILRMWDKEILKN
ncbi:MAG: hypothetical protein PHY59_05025 [Methanobacterium sp.]|nr:hypothetical protein [Methanobacterium sp.]